MARFVFRKNDGSLYSWSPGDNDPVADAETLAASGLAVVSGLAALDPWHAWDDASRSVIKVDPPTPVRAIPSWQWIMRFTPAEFVALRSSTDARTMQFMYALDRTSSVNLNDPVMRQGVEHVVSIDLLDAARIDAILA